MVRRFHTEHALASAFGNLVARFEVDGLVQKEVEHQDRDYLKMRHDGQSSQRYYNVMRWRMKRIFGGKLQIVSSEAQGWVLSVPLHALLRFFVSRDLWVEGASPPSERFWLKLIPPSACRETEFWWAVEAVKLQTIRVRISWMFDDLCDPYQILIIVLHAQQQKPEVKIPSGDYKAAMGCGLDRPALTTSMVANCGRKQKFKRKQKARTN